jgi:hypothetical protein
VVPPHVDLAVGLDHLVGRTGDGDHLLYSHADVHIGERAPRIERVGLGLLLLLAVEFLALFHLEVTDRARPCHEDRAKDDGDQRIPLNPGERLLRGHAALHLARVFAVPLLAWIAVDAEIPRNDDDCERSAEAHNEWHSSLLEQQACRPVEQSSRMMPEERRHDRTERRAAEGAEG